MNSAGNCSKELKNQELNSDIFGDRSQGLSSLTVNCSEMNQVLDSQRVNSTDKNWFQGIDHDDGKTWDEEFRSNRVNDEKKSRPEPKSVVRNLKAVYQGHGPKLEAHRANRQDGKFHQFKDHSLR